MAWAGILPSCRRGRASGDGRGDERGLLGFGSPRNLICKAPEARAAITLPNIRIVRSQSKRGASRTQSGQGRGGPGAASATRPPRLPGGQPARRGVHAAGPGGSPRLGRPPTVAGTRVDDVVGACRSGRGPAHGNAIDADHRERPRRPSGKMSSQRATARPDGPARRHPPAPPGVP